MSDPLPLAARVAELNQSRVLCIGDVMLDRFVYGTVSRISARGADPGVPDRTRDRGAGRRR